MRFQMTLTRIMKITTLVMSRPSIAMRHCKLGESPNSLLMMRRRLSFLRLGRAAFMSRLMSKMRIMKKVGKVI